MPKGIYPRTIHSRRFWQIRFSGRTDRYRQMHRAQWAARKNFPPARTFKCVDCRMPAKEYDHPKGYSEQFKLHVEPVCRRCHVARGYARGEHKPISKRQLKSLIKGSIRKSRELRLIGGRQRKNIGPLTKSKKFLSGSALKGGTTGKLGRPRKS